MGHWVFAHWRSIIPVVMVLSAAVWSDCRASWHPDKNLWESQSGLSSLSQAGQHLPEAFGDYFLFHRKIRVQTFILWSFGWVRWAFVWRFEDGTPNKVAEQPHKMFGFLRFQDYTVWHVFSMFHDSYMLRSHVFPVAFYLWRYTRYFSDLCINGNCSQLVHGHITFTFDPMPHLSIPKLLKVYPSMEVNNAQMF